MSAHLFRSFQPTARPPLEQRITRNRLRRVAARVRTRDELERALAAMPEDERDAMRRALRPYLRPGVR